MNDGRNELNNLLLDKQYDKSSTSLKKIILIGLFLFAISAGIFMLIKTINEDDTFSNNLIEPSILEQQSIKQSNPSLFKNINNPDAINNQAKEETKSITGNLLEQLTAKNKQTKDTALFGAKPEAKPIQEPQDIRNVGTKPSTPKPKKYNQPKIPSEVKRGFYVQVGAFYTRNPDKPFLDSIARKNYGYKIYKLKLNNKDLTKVLIGPYETRQDALRKLPDIKQIEKDAYILKIN